MLLPIVHAPVENQGWQPVLQLSFVLVASSAEMKEEAVLRRRHNATKATKTRDICFVFCVFRFFLFDFFKNKNERTLQTK